MALTEHEQTILSEMELALRAHGTRPGSALHPRRLQPHHDLAVAFGLLIAGAAATALGLRMRDNLGTTLGVLGFVFIVCACWSVIRPGSPARDKLSRVARTQWQAALQDAGAARPPHHLDDGQRGASPER